MRTYQRPMSALSKRAREAGLRERCYYKDGLTVDYICDNLHVDRQTVITSWIKNHGLPCKQAKKGRRQYIVKEEDLLAFLKEHTGMYDASLFDDYAFIREPDWLKAKRTHDRVHFPKNDKKDWSRSEEYTLERMFFDGRTDAEIATELRRSEDRVKERRCLLKFTRDRWNKRELLFLQENSRYMTIEELAEKLPLRTVKAVEMKLVKSGLPSHWSKDRCEKR